MSTRLRLPRGFVVALRDGGVDVWQTAREAGLDPSVLDEVEPSLEPAELGALFASVFAASAPLGRALAIGDAVKPELFGAVGLTALTAATFGAAIERCGRYKRLLLADLRVGLTRDGARGFVRIDLPGAVGPVARGRVEMELAFFTGFGRRLTSPAVEPLEVHLTAPAPTPATSVYEDYFGCPVRHRQPADGLWYSLDALAAPLLGADPELHALVTGAADRRLATAGDGTVHRTRAAIAALLPEGTPPVQQVARRLALSERSLQRHLQAEGTSFSALVDATRRDLACHHLAHGPHETAEIAFLLGFSNLSSFYRAFRRWSDTTPEAYRRGASEARER